MGHYCFAGCRRYISSSVTLPEGRPPGAWERNVGKLPAVGLGALTVGRPTLHGVLVVLRPGRVTHCLKCEDVVKGSYKYTQALLRTRGWNAACILFTLLAVATETRHHLVEHIPLPCQTEISTVSLMHCSVLLTLLVRNESESRCSWEIL